MLLTAGAPLGCGAKSQLIVPAIVADVPDVPDADFIAEGPNIAIGDEHACLRTRDRLVSCWGNDISNQLDFGPILTPQDYLQSAPRPVASLGAASAISADASHSCALMPDGSVRCWGNDTNCGLYVDFALYGARPPVVAGLADAVDVCSGRDFDCALRADGTVWCWGLGSNGALGSSPGAMADRCGIHAAAPVVGITDATKLACGDLHVCVVRRDQTVWCWGGGTFGQRGPGRNDGDPPGQVSGLPPAVALSADGYATCVRDGGGHWWCWGWTPPEIFDAPPAVPSTPAHATQLDGATEIVVSAPSGACGVFQGGELRCWQGAVAAGGASVPGSTGQNPLPGRSVSHVAIQNGAIVCASTMHRSRADRSELYCWGIGGRAFLSPWNGLSAGAPSPQLQWSEPAQ